MSIKRILIVGLTIVLMISLSACNRPLTRGQRGALVGGAVGAGVGGLVTRSAGGAVVGGAAGAIVGGVAARNR